MAESSFDSVVRFIPYSLLLTTAVVSLLVMAFAARAVSWGALKEYRGTQHFFWGSVVVLAVFWQMRAGILPGMHFHILGYTSIMLLMGWPLALIAAAFVQLIMLLTGKLEWLEFGFQYLFFSVLPILFSYAFYLVVYRRMVHNPFVYILVAGFFNAGFTHAFSDVLRSGLMWGLDIHSWDTIWRDYLRYLPMMMFPEGVVNGMFIAGMVAFHNRWLSTFDEDSYFR
ncbi:hypothetical protein A3759_14400 [Thalassolituus sp. HI0120]|nr:hypothetical protein A3759_14400 [Thalassolituus sp. HI0120]